MGLYFDFSATQNIFTICHSRKVELSRVDWTKKTQLTAEVERNVLLVPSLGCDVGVDRGMEIGGRQMFALARLRANNFCNSI